MAVGDLREPDDFLQALYNDTPLIVRKSVTFTATGLGAVGAHDLFVVTGDVKVKVYAVCKVVTAIETGATVEVGIAGATAVIIAQTAGDAPDAGEIWHDASPDAEFEAESVAPFNIISDGNDIIMTIGTDTINSGQIDFYCEWKPLSLGATVVAG